jgi:hypothetical protein
LLIVQEIGSYFPEPIGKTGNAMKEIRGTRTLSGKIKRYDAKLLYCALQNTAPAEFRRTAPTLQFEASPGKVQTKNVDVQIDIKVAENHPVPFDFIFRKPKNKKGRTSRPAVYAKVRGLSALL